MEAAAEKGCAIRTTNLEDGRLFYILTQHGVELLPVSPGDAARYLGVVWP